MICHQDNSVDRERLAMRDANVAQIARPHSVVAGGPADALAQAGGEGVGGSAGLHDTIESRPEKFLPNGATP